MPAKKKIGKKKPKSGQVIKQTVNVHIGSKYKRKGGKRVAKKTVYSPIDRGLSGSYFVSHGITPQPMFTQQDNRMLISDLKREFPLLGYTPTMTMGAKPPYVLPPTSSGIESQPATPQIMQGESEEETPSGIQIEEVPTTGGFQSEPTITFRPPSKPRGAPDEDKITESRQKLMQYGFPERIAVSGGNRTTDTEAVIQRYLDVSRSNPEANIRPADIKRVYKIDEKTQRSVREKLSGIQEQRRKSNIPNPREYNLV